MEKKGKRLWKIFISTLYLSAFTFGGGYVIVTLMKKKFVDELHWIDENEMLDLVAIAQSDADQYHINYIYLKYRRRQKRCRHDRQGQLVFSLHNAASHIPYDRCDHRSHAGLHPVQHGLNDKIRGKCGVKK